MRRCRNAGRRRVRTQSAAAAVGIERRGQIAAVGVEIRQAIAVSVCPLDPTPGCLDADTDPVVLTDEQQRHRHSLICGVQRGVDRADRGGVVHRRVAEAAHRECVVRPWAGHPKLFGACDGERDPDGPRQVRRDGRRLRNDVQVVPAEDLVPPTGDRLVGGRHQAEQHIPQWLATVDQGGAGQEEGAGSIMQQRRVGRPQCRRDGGVALVPGRSDRVVALSLRPQPTRGQIEVAAAELNIEQRQAHSRRQR